MMNHTPFIYAFLKPEKSFNPSANPSFSLIFRKKVAEGFGFQTLQPTLQLRSKRAPEGQRALSPGHRPGYDEAMKCALNGQKHYRASVYRDAFALSGSNSGG